MTKILYIAGYGRCGSTVLATVLGNHPQIASVGEVSFLYEDWASSARTCSCGERYAECNFWGGTLSGSDVDAGTHCLVRKLERASFFPRLLLGWVPSKAREDYRIAQEKLFGHVTAQDGATIVVDSSKSARFTVGRSLALRKLGGHDVYFVHLVRNGWSTLESRVITGSNWALEGHAREPKLPALRAVLGWVWSNLCASMMRRVFGSRRYLLLRYEDFLADPTSSIRKIGELLEVDTSMLVQRIERGDAFDVGHMVGGNRVRFEKAIVLRREETGKAGKKLTRRQRRLFTLLGGWLNRRYGYPR